MAFVPGSHWFIHAKRVEFCGAVTIQRALRASGALAEKLHMDIDYAAVGRSHDGCWPGPTRPVASGPEVGLAARRRDLE